MKSTFLLFFQSYPPTTLPWRIAETVVTSEGYRTRMTSHSFGSGEEHKAIKMIKELEERNK